MSTIGLPGARDRANTSASLSDSGTGEFNHDTTWVEAGQQENEQGLHDDAGQSHQELDGGENGSQQDEEQVGNEVARSGASDRSSGKRDPEAEDTDGANTDRISGGSSGGGGLEEGEIADDEADEYWDGLSRSEWERQAFERIAEREARKYIFGVKYGHWGDQGAF